MKQPGKVSKARVLVVDDEEPIRALLKRFLTGKGYPVETASSGEEAVQKAESFHPSFVLLDIHMSGMDGLEVLKAVKQRAPETTVIMITGVQEELVAQEAIRLGAYDYITKPFSLDYLEKALLVKLL